MGLVFVVGAVGQILWNVARESPASPSAWGALTGGAIVLAIGLWLGRAGGRRKA